jgi:pilus assembly protein Flp/PilA
MPSTQNLILFIYICSRKEVNGMWIKRKWNAQGLVEYALILVLIAIVVIIVLSVLGTGIGNMFSTILHTV